MPLEKTVVCTFRETDAGKRACVPTCCGEEGVSITLHLVVYRNLLC